MATLTIRDLDDSVRDRLRARASENGRSMEAEVRDILRRAVSPVESTLFDVLAAFHAEAGRADLDDFIPSRADDDRSALG